MTFSIIFTFTDFQLVYAITRGGPVNSTHLMATLAFQRGISAGMLGEGAAIAIAMVPFLVFATLFSYFALARRKWQQERAMTSAPSLAAENSAAAPAEAMAWESRAKRAVFVYVPLVCFVFILLFPFYWMTITAFKPNAELYSYKTHNPFWIAQPTLDHIRRLLFETSYPRWLWTTMTVAIGATFLSLFASVFAAYAIQRLRFKASEYVGLAIYLGYLVPPSILFIPLSTTVFRLGLFDTPLALILVYPTFLVPFCTWLLIGYFKSIPYEMEECALIDGATRLQILRLITLPLAIPGLISAGIFSFTLSWNEFIYALAFIQSSEKKTVPVAILTELVSGDVYQWGALMAGSLLGSLPVAIFYSFFVDYYVSSLSGAVKE